MGGRPWGRGPRPLNSFLGLWASLTLLNADEQTEAQRGKGRARMKGTQHAKALSQSRSPGFLTPGLSSSHPLLRTLLFNKQAPGLPSGLVDGGAGLWGSGHRAQVGPGHHSSRARGCNEAGCCPDHIPLLDPEPPFFPVSLLPSRRHAGKGFENRRAVCLWMTQGPRPWGTQEPSSLGTGTRSSMAERCPEAGVAGARAQIQETDLGFRPAAVPYGLYDLGKCF